MDPPSAFPRSREVVYPDLSLPPTVTVQESRFGYNIVTLQGPDGSLLGEWADEEDTDEEKRFTLIMMSMGMDALKGLLTEPDMTEKVRGRIEILLQRHAAAVAAHVPPVPALSDQTRVQCIRPGSLPVLAARPRRAPTNKLHQERLEQMREEWKRKRAARLEICLEDRINALGRAVSGGSLPPRSATAPEAPCDGSAGAGRRRTSRHGIAPTYSTSSNPSY